MKSGLIIIVVLLGFGYSAQAQQRMCDLEAVCISPADTVKNGKSLPLRFGGKNLGPDTMFKNDITNYQLTRIVEGKTTVDYTGAFAGSQRTPVNIGDRAIYMDNYTIRFNYPDLVEPLTLDYCVQIWSSAAGAQGDAISDGYWDTNRTNNRCCRKVVVMPGLQTNAIGQVTSNAAAGFSVYPNPATHTLYLGIAEGVVRDGVLLFIVDLMGRNRLIKNSSDLHWQKGVSAIDVRELPTGVYQLNLITSQGLLSKRFSVSK